VRLVDPVQDRQAAFASQLRSTFLAQLTHYLGLAGDYIPTKLTHYQTFDGNGIDRGLIISTETL